MSFTCHCPYVYNLWPRYMPMASFSLTQCLLLKVAMTGMFDIFNLENSLSFRYDRKQYRFCNQFCVSLIQLDLLTCNCFFFCFVGHARFVRAQIKAVYEWLVYLITFHDPISADLINTLPCEHALFKYL